MRRVTGSVVAGAGKLGKRATDEVENIGKGGKEAAERVKERDAEAKAK